MSELGDKLGVRGVRQPLVVIEEAKRADIKVASALAMLEMETGIPQNNIFGGDYGSRFAGVPPYYHDHVTALKVKRLLAQPLNNGVGWTQLTSRPFVEEAERLGGAHIPRYQMRVGFRVLRENFERTDSIRGMFVAYNGSGAAAEAYGTKAVGLREKWLGVTEGK